MIPITWQSAPAYLIDDLWNGGTFDADFSIPLSIERGATGREDRVLLGETPRIKARFQTILSGPASIAGTRNALQGYTTQPILCPFWPGMRISIADVAKVTSGWWMVWTPSSATVYSTGSLPGSLPAGAKLVPLMVGRLVSKSLGMITNQSALAKWEFEETSEDFLSFASFTPTAGPSIDGDVRFLIPPMRIWASNPEVMVDVDVRTESIGPGRTIAQIYYDQLSIRNQKSSAQLIGDDAWKLLRFWVDRGGAHEPFWMGSAVSEVVLTADVVSGATTLSVDSPLRRGNNTWFLLESRTARRVVQVTTDGVGAWGLAAAVGADFAKTQTNIFSAVLGRFSDTISIRWEHSELATVTFGVREVPWETITPGGESNGVTTGALPQSAYTYRFISGTTEYLFADAGTLVDGTNTWAGKQISHGDIRETLGLDRQTVQVNTIAFAGNPLLMLIPHTLEAPLWLEICEVEVLSGTILSSTCVFYGQVESVTTDGPDIHAMVNSSIPGSFLERQIPRQLIQRTCNWTLFEGACGLSKAAFEYQGTVTAVSGNNVTIGSLSKTGAPAKPSLTAHYFAGGYMQVGSAYRVVADSQAESGTTIILSVPFAGSPLVGQTVKIYPGCDGQFGTCHGKFNNRGRFGGFPWPPVGNPSMISADSNISSGGKK